MQAQLTDNSWLLYSDVRLTGGFAYVVWFGGPKRGEFVLTMGGFHPDFHRDGYPVVPRLGLQWSIGSAIVIKGGAYFALTSEAVMAGVEVEVSASFGWAWARLSFGAHGIVFFDPFHYKVTAYVRIAAGITIDTWFGDITFSISCGAELTVEGPEFHGRAKIDVGPCTVSVPFGADDDQSTPRLTVGEFVPKYLEEAAAGVASALSSIVSAGAVPPHTSGGPAPEPPDGGAARPYVVTAEFVMTVTTTVPATAVDVGGAPKPFTPTRVLGIGPMGVPSVSPTLTLRWQQGVDGAGLAVLRGDADALRLVPARALGPAAGRRRAEGADRRGRAGAQPGAAHRARRRLGWRPGDRLQPAGPVRPAPAAAVPAHLGSGPHRDAQPGQEGHQPGGAAAADGDAVLLADSWRAGAGASALELAAWRNERRTVGPLLGSLADRLARTDTAVVPTVADPVVVADVDAYVHPPVALALLGAGTPLEGARNGGGTTVSDRPRAKRVAPPSVAGLTNVPAAARLVVGGGGVSRSERSVTPMDVPAVTRAARVAGAAVTRRGGPGRGRLDDITGAMAATTKAAGGTTVRAGEVAVLALPNAHRDVDGTGERPALAVRGCPARVVVLTHGGTPLVDQLVADAAAVAVPQGAERIVVAPLGEGVPTPSLAGWHGGQTLAYVGWDTALATDASVHVDGTTVARRDDRYRAGWTEAAELVDGSATVTTRFTRPVDVVLVVVDDPSAEVGRRLLLGLDGADPGRWRRRRAAAADGAGVGQPDLPRLPGGARGRRDRRCDDRERHRLAPGRRARRQRRPGRPGRRAGRPRLRRGARHRRLRAGPGRGPLAGRAGGQGRAAPTCGEEDGGEEDDGEEDDGEDGAKKTAAKRRGQEDHEDEGALSHGRARDVRPAQLPRAAGEGRPLPAARHPADHRAADRRARVGGDGQRAAVRDAAGPDPLDLPAGDGRGRLRQPAAADRAEAAHAAMGARPRRPGQAGQRPAAAMAGAGRHRRGRGGAVAGAGAGCACVTPGVTIPHPEEADSPTGYFLTVTQTVVDKVFPTVEDLPLLVHVREVDVADTELANGDDDGWLAVVLANRLPIAVPHTDPATGTVVSAPVKYLACLVNLEGQVDALPTDADLETDDELVLTAAVQDLSLLAAATRNADQVVMGTGHPYALAKRAGVSDVGALSVQAATPAPHLASGTWATAASADRGRPRLTHDDGGRGGAQGDGRRLRPRLWRCISAREDLSVPGAGPLELHRHQRGRLPLAGAGPGRRPARHRGRNRLGHRPGRQPYRQGRAPQHPDGPPTRRAPTRRRSPRPATSDCRRPPAAAKPPGPGTGDRSCRCPLETAIPRQRRRVPHVSDHCAPSPRRAVRTSASPRPSRSAGCSASRSRHWSRALVQWRAEQFGAARAEAATAAG